METTSIEIQYLREHAMKLEAENRNLRFIISEQDVVLERLRTLGKAMDAAEKIMSSAPPPDAL